MLVSIIVIIGGILFDQATKHLAQALLMSGDSLMIVPMLLEFRYVMNTGAAYGSMENSQLLFFFATTLALLVLGFFLGGANYKKKRVFSLAIAFLIAGALGNAIDRIFLGYVIDYIHFPFLAFLPFNIGNFYCNPADIFLSAGVVLFIIDLIFFESSRVYKKEKQ